MLARFRALLSAPVFVPMNAQFGSFQFQDGDVSVSVSPPLQSEPPTPDYVLEVSTPPKPSARVLIHDSECYEADLIQIDFRKAAFDRSRDKPSNAWDPSLPFMIQWANRVVRRLRLVTGGAHLRDLTEELSRWQVDYLSDDGKPLEIETPTLTKRRKGVHTPIRFTVVDDAIWQAALCGSDEGYVWDTLLLEADAALPAIGPSIALASAALETLIAWALDALVELRNTIPNELWTWITDRGDHQKEPSVNEQFDTLFGVLTGESLKRTPYWPKYVDLRKARNSLSHEGVPLLANRQRVTLTDAHELVQNAKSIAAWVETHLPASLRRPRSERQYRATFILPVDIARMKPGAAWRVEARLSTEPRPGEPRAPVSETQPPRP